MDELTNSLLLESCRVAEDVTRGREIYRRMRHSGMTPPARCCRWLVQGAVRRQSRWAAPAMAAPDRARAFSRRAAFSARAACADAHDLDGVLSLKRDVERFRWPNAALVYAMVLQSVFTITHDVNAVRRYWDEMVDVRGAQQRFGHGAEAMAYPLTGLCMRRDVRRSRRSGGHPAGPDHVQRVAAGVHLCGPRRGGRPLPPHGRRHEPVRCPGRLHVGRVRVKANVRASPSGIGNPGHRTGRCIRTSGRTR